ncbi:hypothetical protein BpHYR1_006942, partial [Brachionus plicatilis]
MLLLHVFYGVFIVVEIWLMLFHSTHFLYGIRNRIWYTINGRWSGESVNTSQLIQMNGSSSNSSIGANSTIGPEPTSLVLNLNHKSDEKSEPVMVLGWMKYFSILDSYVRSLDVSLVAVVLVPVVVV